MITINAITKYISSFNIVQRAIFILSIVIVVWILFILIYFTNRLIVRLISYTKPFRGNPSSKSNGKISRAFVIATNHYGPVKPITTIYRPDSLFSNSNLSFNNDEVQATFSNYDKLNLTINHYSDIIEDSDCQQSKEYLLKHYLKTYNPLHIDLMSTGEQPTKTRNVTNISHEDMSTDTNVQPINNCYPLNCTNKQKLHENKQYVRLKEQENCSATASIIDDRPSQCSTKLTTTMLPVVMITDCSDSQRLHTDIIEMHEKE